MTTTTTAPDALLTGPRNTFGRFYAERWIKGPEADRRVRALRRAGITVSTRTREDRRKLWSKAGAERVSVVVLEVDYCLPRHLEAPPPVEGEQPAPAAPPDVAVLSAQLAAAEQYAAGLRAQIAAALPLGACPTCAIGGRCIRHAPLFSELCV